jgi:hypothetical protein
LERQNNNSSGFGQKWTSGAGITKSSVVRSVGFVGLKAAKSTEFYQINAQLTEEQIIEKWQMLTSIICYVKT